MPVSLYQHYVECCISKDYLGTGQKGKKKRTVLVNL